MPTVRGTFLRRPPGYRLRISISLGSSHPPLRMPRELSRINNCCRRIWGHVQERSMAKAFRA
eukprot:5691401-Alexandrium_andersonii.AAC.1